MDKSGNSLLKLIELLLFIWLGIAATSDRKRRRGRRAATSDRRRRRRRSATIGDRFFSRTRVGHFDITAKEGDILVQSDADIRLLPNAFYAAPDARLVASSDRVDDAYNRRLLPAYMATGGAISLRAERTDARRATRRRLRRRPRPAARPRRR